jgi:predicted ATPase
LALRAGRRECDNCARRHTIELAAARIKLLSPQAILSRLEHSLKLLTGGARDLLERQHNIREAIAWSFDLLDEGEKRLLIRLAVFAEEWTLEAAEAVCNALLCPTHNSQ